MRVYATRSIVNTRHSSYNMQSYRDNGFFIIACITQYNWRKVTLIRLTALPTGFAQSSLKNCTLHKSVRGFVISISFINPMFNVVRKNINPSTNLFLHKLATNIYLIVCERHFSENCKCSNSNDKSNDVLGKLFSGNITKPTNWLEKIKKFNRINYIFQVHNVY